MNPLPMLAWASLGVAAGALFAPTAAWLAEVPHRAHYRPVISTATAVTFAVLAHRYTSTPELLALTIFAAVGVLLAAIDILAQRLPRTLVWPSCTAVAALLVTDSIDNGADMARLLGAGAGAVVLAGGYLIIAFASRGGLGAGDIRTAVLVGGVLGWHGWPALVAGTMLGFLVTSTIAVASTGPNRKQTAIPHGPGMLAGAFTALLL